MAIVQVRPLLSTKGGTASEPEDGVRIAELVIRDPETILDFSKIDWVRDEFCRAMFGRLAEAWGGLESIEGRLKCKRLSWSEGRFWRILATWIDEKNNRHPDWQPGHCFICNCLLPKKGIKYCSNDCKVIGWEKRGGVGSRPQDGAPPFGQTWVRKLAETRMFGSKVEPDQVLKAISELVIENQVLKKENELLRGQLDYLKGTRTDLSNAKGYLPSDVLTAQEAADYLKISVATLNGWRSTGDHSIPYSKVGRSVRYRVADLDALLFRSERSLANRMKATERENGQK